MRDTADEIAPKARNKVGQPEDKIVGGGESAVTEILSSSKEKKKEVSGDNPFDQYYAQLIHQQNMLQDSVRVSAYQRAICENAADFKVRCGDCWPGVALGVMTVRRWCWLRSNHIVVECVVGLLFFRQSFRMHISLFMPNSQYACCSTQYSYRAAVHQQIQVRTDVADSSSA